jgi:hypothetical protein
MKTMVEKKISPFDGERMVVKYKDIFDLKEFYTALHHWLIEYGWVSHDGEGDHWETYYSERIDKGGVKEVWVTWNVKKELDGAPARYELEIKYHGLGLKKKDVVIDGEKMTVDSGEVEMTLLPMLYLTYLDEFEKDKLISKFKKLTAIFTKQIYDDKILQLKKDLYHEIYALNNFMKQWLKLKRYLPYEEVKGFHASQAWPSHLK